MYSALKLVTRHSQDIRLTYRGDILITKSHHITSYPTLHTRYISGTAFYEFSKSDKMFLRHFVCHQVMSETQIFKMYKMVFKTIKTILIHFKTILRHFKTILRHATMMPR